MSELIYKKFKLKWYKKDILTYLSLWEITSQEFLDSWNKDMLTANIVFDKNPERFIDEELRKFSDYYKVGKKSIFYNKKYSFLNLKLYIKDLDTNNVTFYLNKSYYNIVKFRMDNLYPLGIHISDIFLTKLLNSWNLVVHGACLYSEKNKWAFSLVAPPDTGKTYTTYKFLETPGFKFLGEDLSLWDSKKDNINCMPYTSTWEHRFKLWGFHIWKIPFLGIMIPHKKHSVYDIFGKEKVQEAGASKIIYLLEQSDKKEGIELVTKKKLEKVIEKVKLIQRNEFWYYKNPLLLAFDYFNNTDLEKTKQKEDDLIDQYFEKNKVYLVNAKNYMDYYGMIKEHQENEA